MAGGTLVSLISGVWANERHRTACVLILLPLYPILQFVVTSIGHLDSFFVSIFDSVYS